MQDFVSWLDLWNSLDVGHKLTVETHKAIRHSTQTLLDLCDHCCNELGFSYLLTGKIQTDCLEARFGKYRTMTGCQYLISMRQLYEVEKKIRLQNTLPLILNSSAFGEINLSNIFVETGECEIVNSSLEINDVSLDYTSEDFDCIESFLPALTYIAGYCVNSLIKKYKCEHCKEMLVIDKEISVNVDSAIYDYIKSFDRGGLKYPILDIVNAASYCYITMSKLTNDCNENFFTKCSSQRSVLINYSKKIILDSNFFLVDYSCTEHLAEKILQDILKTCSNIFINNYIKKINDSTVRDKLSRKLTTFV